MLDVRIEGAAALEQAGLLQPEARKRFRQKISAACREFGADAEGRSKRNYLSGPRPWNLGVVSNRLRSSVTHDVQEKEDDIEIALGTNVVYGRVWEFGFQGVENVKPHMRVVKKVFGRDVQTVSAVRGHTRQVDKKARPFLGPAISDALPPFEQKILNAMEQVNFTGEF